MINFIKYNKIYYAISGLAIGLSLVSLVMWGLKPSIDFTGGALLEVKTEAPNVEADLESKINEISDVNVASIQYSSSTQSYVVRLNSVDETKKNEILDKIRVSYSDVSEQRFETVGPTLGRELLIKTGIAVLIAAIAITMYVGYQFKDRKYGLSAVLAMIHDTIVLLGAFSILGHFKGVEVDTLFVTAVLTTLSFSVHDTIVVFDRIRESARLRPNADLNGLVNKALTETLSRSLNNSMTIIFMLSALAVLGGDTIRWFVVALLVGTVSGTYSSPFVASPILLFLYRKKK